MIKDLTNNIFGKLTALTYLRRDVKTYWVCKCDCGNIKEVLSSNLVRGLSRSCGCSVNRQLIRHNMYGTKIHQSWRSMKARCNASPTEKQYKNYGARGIIFCKEWDSFEGFYKDMKEGYIEGYTLERKDVDKGYDKDNCIWVPRSEQNKNKKSTPRFQTIWGYITIHEAIKFSGLTHATIIGRRSRGWSDEQIFKTRT